MNTIAVISDTHGNRELMDKVISFIKNVHNADMMFHLGDSYADGVYMQDKLGITSFIVPGIYCDEYTDTHIPNVAEENICGKKVGLVHSMKDCKDLGGYDIICCGHTHIPALEEHNGTFIINPGHLKENNSKGRAYSYSVLKKNDSGIILEWYHPCEAPILCRREILESI